MTRRVSGLLIRCERIQSKSKTNRTHLWVCLKVLSNEGVSVVPQYPPLSHVRLVLVRESVVGEGAAAETMRQGEGKGVSNLVTIRFERERET